MKVYLKLSLMEIESIETLLNEIHRIFNEKSNENEKSQDFFMNFLMPEEIESLEKIQKILEEERTYLETS